MKRISTYLVLFVLLIVALAYINDETSLKASKKKTKVAETTPNYELVFPNDRVNRIDIKIDNKQWETMNAALTSSHRPPHGASSHFENERTKAAMRKARPRLNPDNLNNTDSLDNRKPKDMTHPEMTHERRAGPPPRMRPQHGKEQNNWSYCTIQFNEQKWEKVGIRYKGNSSLRHSVQMGIKKLSFKLDFDEFEEQFPEIKNQRFYGFKQLNLKNNYKDASLMREKVASDLFSEFGLVSPKTAFYKVYVDYGEGATYFGLYTMVEEVDDTVIKSTYKEQDGNLYKPEGLAATFTKDSFDKVLVGKKNNKKANDYEDIERLSKILNNELRNTDYNLWKQELEDLFDVDIFLRYLAANNVIQNWDTYGNTTHNYYLYHNSQSDKFEWIPWDNNEALQAGNMFETLPLSLNSTNENWPLIRYIIDDKEWNAIYQNYISEFANTVFYPQKMTETYDTYYRLINTSVIGENGEQKPYSFLTNNIAFEKEVTSIKKHVYQRAMAVKEYLNQQNL